MDTVMTRWFISDHHFFHDNIIKYSNRPFKDIYEMTEVMVERHNSVVKPEDHVSFLGDVTILRGGKREKAWFCTTIKRMNGHKRLFLGNHDHFPVQVYLWAGFEKVYATWRDDNGVLFSHIPVHPMSMGSAIANVHGHIHTNPDYEPVMTIDKKTQRVVYKPYVNLSVEVINYTPVDYDTLLQMIAAKKGQWDGVKT